jgi:two-component system response regulator FixJ
LTLSAPLGGNFAAAINEDRGPSPLLSRGRGLGMLRQSPVRRTVSSARLAEHDCQTDWGSIASAIDLESSDNEDLIAAEGGLVQLLDNDPAALRAAERILDAAGFQVRSHLAADTLLSEINHGRPCCLLLSIDASGLDVLMELKRRGVLWPVIMTGRSKIGGVVQAMKSGALDFLETPLESQVLLEALQAGFRLVDQVREQSERIARAHAVIDRLTAREREVMSGLLAGLPNKLIARQMDLSVRTVEIYRATVMSKLQVRSISSIVRLAIDAGIEPLIEDWRGF